DAILRLLEKRGVKAQLLETPGAPPVVYGHIETPGATRTITFYAHYDGQPLDPKEWATPPWQPVLRDGPLDRDGQIVSLATATNMRPPPADKAPILALATALDPIHAASLRLQSNVKFVFEGEEEAGSPNLGTI